VAQFYTRSARSTTRLSASGTPRQLRPGRRSNFAACGGRGHAAAARAAVDGFRGTISRRRADFGQEDRRSAGVPPGAHQRRSRWSLKPVEVTISSLELLECAARRRVW